MNFDVRHICNVSYQTRIKFHVIQIYISICIFFNYLTVYFTYIVDEYFALSKVKLFLIKYYVM
jgi:hypothetical protein